MPEHCPVCGGENVDENGEWLYCEEPFCSQKCYDRYCIMIEEKNGAW